MATIGKRQMRRVVIGILLGVALLLSAGGSAAPTASSSAEFDEEWLYKYQEDFGRLFEYREDLYLLQLLDHVENCYKSNQICPWLPKYGPQHVVVLFDKLRQVQRENILQKFPFNVVPERLKEDVEGLKAWSEGTLLDDQLSKYFKVCFSSCQCAQDGFEQKFLFCRMKASRTTNFRKCCISLPIILRQIMSCLLRC